MGEVNLYQLETMDQSKVFEKGYYGGNNKKQPDEFEIESTSVWSFPDRGTWATHSGEYRGNWSPYVPRNIILRYSKMEDIVLDPFVGSGTTLVECKLLGRKGIGVDINPHSLNIAKRKILFEYEKSFSQRLICGDARNMDYIPNGSIDLICTHPPYSDIIKYSNGIEGDISLHSIEEFLDDMVTFSHECMRVLRCNKYCAVLIGDVRKNGQYIPLSSLVMNQFIKSGFDLKETVIKVQHNCKMTEYWKERSKKYNFLLISHEYLYVFRKK